MNKTNIEWTDFTWNPVTGCRNGCPYCYARDLYQRHGWSFAPAFHPERLDQPRKRRGAGRVFVCSVADLFGSWVPSDWIDQVMGIIRSCPNHTFQLLTKNPARLQEYSPFPENVWAGVTAVDQSMAESAVSRLRKIEAPVKFVSCEPLLGPIDVDLSGIDWLIIGGCTGPLKRQPENDWVERLVGRGREAGSAVFLKKNLTWPNPPREFPA